MVSTISDSDVVYERRTERVHKYHWPAIQLNLWMLFMLVASCAILGMFANFISIQQQLRLAVPWYVWCMPSLSHSPPRLFIPGTLALSYISSSPPSDHRSALFR